MAKLGAGSLAQLGTCHPDLQRLVRALVADLSARPGRYVKDVTVLCGFRNQHDQDDAYKRGASKLPWPKSRHNTYPARAVDVVPYPLDWNDMRAFAELRTRMRAQAKALGIAVRFISWDWPHVELV